MSQAYQAQTITLSDKNPHLFGHLGHWQALLGDDSVNEWLHLALAEASVVGHLPESRACLIRSNQRIATQLLYQLNDEAQPNQLVYAAPLVHSPHRYSAKFNRVWQNSSKQQALLEIELAGQIKMFAYHSDYLSTQTHQNTQNLSVSLSGLALNLAHSSEADQVQITDSKSIEQHRALIELLLSNNKQLPTDAREQIQSLIDSGTLPDEPIKLSFQRMCAYLYGDQIGQQDEAWCQGEVIGKQSVTIYSKQFILLDVVVLREEDTLPVVLRIAVREDLAPKPLKVGDFIQGNIWLQAQICVTPD